MGTTRFPNGVTNATADTCLGEYLDTDPTKVFVFYEDFINYTAAEWTITTTEGGSGDATEALTTDANGTLLVTNDNADDDADFFQRANLVLTLSATKKAWFKIRFKTSDATQSDINCGLQVVDTTPLACTDGIWFRKDDGDTNIDFIVQKDDSTGKNTGAAIGTLANDTYITLGWYYDGNGLAHAYVNDVFAKQLDASSTYFPNANLAVSFGIQNGTNAAKTLTVDYVFAAVER